jgi:hypothetical protein
MQRLTRAHIVMLGIVAAVLLSAAPAAGQFRMLGVEAEPLVEPRFDLLENAGRAHLERVEQLLADGQEDEAVEILRRVMETDGDKLLLVPEYADGRKTPFVRYYPVWQVCHQKLASLARIAPQALALYRSRVDRVAEQWYQEGVSKRSAEQLERVVRNFFVSSRGDDALWLLGEMQLAAGDYSAARASWEAIHVETRTPPTVDSNWPTPPGKPLWLALKGVDLARHWPAIEKSLVESRGEPNWLVYPDSDIPLAEVRARLVLVSIMEGNLERARLELEILRRLHPETTGRIGGREGRFVDLLSSLLEQSAGWPAIAPPGVWPTFAGANTRMRVLPQELELGAEAVWETDLTPLTSDRDLIGAARPRVAEEHRGLLSYHPVVWNDLVIWAEHTQIKARRLSDGLPPWKGAEDGVIYRFPVNVAADDESEYPISEPHPRSRPYVGVARMTLTVQGDILLARMGSRLTVSAEPNVAAEEKQGVIVGLDLKAQGRMLRGFPLRTEGPAWNFEGTPLTDGANVYVALTKHDQVNAQAHVACYDLATGEQRWRRWICSASTPGHGMRDEISHNLLTLSEGMLYYNTNLGAVAKLSTRDGALQWAVQYPRGAFPNQDPDRRDRHFFRDLTPCVVHRGMVIAAPNDTDRIFGLDATTGQLVWTTPVEVASDAVHLLGIAQDRLIASGDYLYWFDAFTGQYHGQFPPPSKDAPGYALPSPTGQGRGVLAGNLVYWPTRERILVFEQLTQADGVFHVPVAREPIDLVGRKARGGNLLVAGDRFIIAGARELQVFPLLQPTDNKHPDANSKD